MLAFIYLAALWYAAPAWSNEPIDAAARLRIVAIAGIAIPSALAFAGILYAPLVWIVAGATCAWRYRKHVPAPMHDVPLYCTLAATVLVLWPPLVRPLLDGDSLLYHLPNAVAFVQAHSLWTGRAPYWPYPAASELFASGMFAVAGRWSLPLCGMLPALLIVARLYSVARSAAAPAYAAAAIALAFVCTPVAALQAGTLQNDLWLTAFFLEAASSADRSAVSVAVAALVKPFGVIAAAVAGWCGAISLRSFAVAIAAFIVWIARDAIVLALGHALGLSMPPYWTSTIAGNAPVSIAQTLYGVAVQTPQAFLWIALFGIGLSPASTRRYAATGIAMLTLYVFLPLSYGNGTTNYVTDASSLRFALPALACGALVAAALTARAPIVAAAGAYLVAAWGAFAVLALFWNDAYTHWALPAAAIAALCALALRVSRGIALAVCTAAFLIAGVWCSSTRAAGFYGDWMRAPDGKATGAFAYLAREQPAQLVVFNLREGAVLMQTPATRIEGAADVNAACDLAHREGAPLLVGSNEDLQGDALRAAFVRARACGTLMYSDGAAVITYPSASLR